MTFSDFKAIEILVVKDSHEDIRLLQESLKEMKVSNSLSVARDGKEGMMYLLRQGPYADVERPDLILLDLNLPGKDGRAVLGELKAHPELRRIPVVILSGSRTSRDVLQAYSLGASAYMVKPVDPDQLFEFVQKTENLWLTIVHRQKE
jgi:CheY-like chemotaxis protein